MFNMMLAQKPSRRQFLLYLISTLFLLGLAFAYHYASDSIALPSMARKESSSKRLSIVPLVDLSATDMSVSDNSILDVVQSKETTRPQNKGNDSSTLTTSLPTHTTYLPTFYPSKELFIRAIYFDGRSRNNHKNSSVFLVVVKKVITDNNLIVGCQVGNHIAKDFEVRLIGETPLWRAFYPHINHEEAFVECYDLPAQNGSIGYISYKSNSSKSTVQMAASERPLYIPGPPVQPSTEQGKKYNFSIATCAKVFSNPPLLEEWLTYQKTLGVQHVHLDVEDSFVKNGGLKRKYVQEALKKGFLGVEVWNAYLSPNEIWYHNQGLIYEDCTYRFLGVYDYLVLMDTDDFLTPRVPGETQLYYYIDKYCKGKTTGSCKFKWIEFFPDHFGLNKSIPILDGNITRQLNNFSHYIQGNPKSLHRTSVVVDAATHYAYKMLDGFQIEQVSPNVMYVAHIRKGNRLAKGNNLHIGLPHSSAYEHVINKLLLLLMLLALPGCLQLLDIT